MTGEIGRQHPLENLNLADPATEVSAFRGQRIGLFQDPQTSLNPVMTVGEQLETIQTHLQIDAGDAETRHRAFG